MFFEFFFRAALLQMKGKYVVNEKCLVQLFSCRCPLCGSKVNVEKVIHGVLLVLKKQCLKCDYKNLWKSQVNARIPKGGGGAVASEVGHQIFKLTTAKVQILIFTNTHCCHCFSDKGTVNR